MSCVLTCQVAPNCLQSRRPRLIFAPHASVNLAGERFPGSRAEVNAERGGLAKDDWQEGRGRLAKIERCVGKTLHHNPCRCMRSENLIVLTVLKLVQSLIGFNKQQGRSMTNQRQKVQHQSTLMPIAVDVDLVRFEKNLLQIGFFGANDARDKNRTSRRVEQTVIRTVAKSKLLPDFADQSYWASLRPGIAKSSSLSSISSVKSEQKPGVITNLIRLSGYRLIHELGLLHRISDTTITFGAGRLRAEKKTYSDEVLHVFRSFKRT